MQLIYLEDMSGDDGHDDYLDRHVADKDANPVARQQDQRMREALVEAIKNLPVFTAVSAAKNPKATSLSCPAIGPESRPRERFDAGSSPRGWMNRRSPSILRARGLVLIVARAHQTLPRPAARGPARLVSATTRRR